eukprot:GFYU01039164.1.p1 GENE.GFYU01039164.1~~GFYU01039164.1.p1  ORF type:complete len:179 (-),score=37.04 GFYU01039164.1:42-578(-)
MDLPRKRAAIKMVFDAKKNQRLEFYADCNDKEEKVSFVRIDGDTTTCTTMTPPAEFCGPSSPLYMFPNVTIDHDTTIGGLPRVLVKSPNPHVTLKSTLRDDPILRFLLFESGSGIWFEEWGDLSNDQRDTEVSVTGAQGAWEACTHIDTARDVVHPLMKAAGMKDLRDGESDVFTRLF